MPQLQTTKICSLALLLTLAACQSTRLPEDLSIHSGPSTRTTLAPAWVGMEARGWKRLNAIEAWLDTSSSRDPKWRNYARIELAKGWLNQPTTSASASTYRAKRARAILRKVQADPQASAAHRRFANRLINAPTRTTPTSLPTKVRPRNTWAASPSKPSSMTPSGGTWNRITIHHSTDISNLSFNQSLQASAHAVKTIQHQHQSSRGWGDIGYHFLIDALGNTFEGRSMQWQGAHAGDNSKNRHNIGICLLGDFQSEPPTWAAKTAVRELLDELCSRHKITKGDIYLHSHFTPTECPGRALGDWVKEYRATP